MLHLRISNWDWLLSFSWMSVAFGSAVQWALCCFTVLAPLSWPDERLSEHLQHHPFHLEIWNLEPAYPQITKSLRQLVLRMFKAILFCKCSDSDRPPWHASSAIVALATAHARTNRRTESDDQILSMFFVAITHRTSRNVIHSSRVDVNHTGCPAPLKPSTSNLLDASRSHSHQELDQCKRSALQAYRRVNEQFADVILSVAGSTNLHFASFATD